MLSHDEDIKRVGDYTGTSVIMIEKPYGRFVRTDSNFGLRSIAQSENFSENFSNGDNEDERFQEVSCRPRRDLTLWLSA